MIKDPLSNHRACLAGTCLALSTIFVLLSHTTAIAAVDNEKDSGGFVAKMKRWEDQRSQKFHKTVKKLEAESKEKPLTTASADLRKQNDNYNVRLNMPGRNWENSTTDSVHTA